MHMVLSNLGFTGRLSIHIITNVEHLPTLGNSVYKKILLLMHSGRTRKKAIQTPKKELNYTTCNSND